MRLLRRHGTPNHIDQIARWRAGRLRAAGFSGPLAAIIAHDPAYDLHALLELVDRGCAAELAARIVAPLDGEAPRS